MAGVYSSEIGCIGLARLAQSGGRGAGRRAEGCAPRRVRDPWLALVVGLGFVPGEQRGTSGSAAVHPSVRGSFWSLMWSLSGGGRYLHRGYMGGCAVSSE